MVLIVYNVIILSVFKIINGKSDIILKFWFDINDIIVVGISYIIND